MTVWRLHIRPDANRSADPVQFCLDRNVIGIGWSVEPSPKSREEYLEKGRAKYQGSKGWKQAATAIIDSMKQDDIVWFRNFAGDYYLARVTGDWEYRDAPEHLRADLVNIRPVEIFGVGKRVPGKVESSFAPRATLQRITGEEIALYSRIVFNQVSNGEVYPIDGNDKSRSLFELLSPTEIEDAVGIFLQVTQRCAMIPSSRSRSNNTIDHEYELISPETGRRLLVQVKSGSVPLATKHYDRPGEEWWLFTTGNYDGEANDTVHIIQPCVLEAFIRNERRLMPEPIKYWLAFQERP
jgi:hypothetical protein